MIKFKNNSRGKSDLFTFQNNSNFHKINLQSYLADTCVHSVFLCKKFVLSIFEWSERSLESASNPVVEVGGFILGRYAQTPDGNYYVSCEVFCPAVEVDEQSPTKLVIGEKATIVLEQFLGEYTNLCLIGWFHTHPGHTPYLSKTDLECTHELFYTRPYQIAIVLDPTTKSYDTGIFARKSNYTMNNKPDYSKWILWKELKQLIA